MNYPNLIFFYRDQGGAASRETVFGTTSWDEVADPEQKVPIKVRFAHDTGHLFATMIDGSVTLVGTVVGDDYADVAELLSWFQERDGTWPSRSLQDLQARVVEVNGRYAFQTLRRSLPKAGPGAVCVDCGRRAHRVYLGEPICDDCLCQRLGGP